MLKHVLIVSTGILFVSGSATADSVNCWDGTTAVDLAYCPPTPRVTQCYFGPQERFITVIGLEDEPVLVNYGSDTMMTSIRYSKTDHAGQQNAIYLSHGADQTKKFWLESDSEREIKYDALINVDGKYEIRNSGGARMIEFECLLNSVKMAAESNDASYQEIILNCGN